MKRDLLDHVAQVLFEDIPTFFGNLKTILWWSFLPSLAFGLIFWMIAWRLQPGDGAFMLRAALLGIIAGVFATAIAKNRWWREHWPRHDPDWKNR